MSDSECPSRDVDALIIGGGIAALWTAATLRSEGYSVIVLTNAALGTGQSLAAQGVIHGGLKYAVGGTLTESSEALAEMPDRWRAALRGDGPVDLRTAELLSEHQILWSLPGVLSQVVGFFGSKMVRGRSRALAKDEYPAPFHDPRYGGRIFQIDEPVVDPVSVIAALAELLRPVTYLVDWQTNASLVTGGDGLEAVRLRQEDGSKIRIKAKRYLFAAGAGNAGLLAELNHTAPAMQLRPLHQLIIRRQELPEVYSVCVGSGPKPPMVVTTHTDSAGRKVWYVGGDIAESVGVARDEAAQISAGRELFARLQPWVDLTEAEWFTSRSERAEPDVGTGDRPPGAYCQRLGNVLVAWPTKLALAPNLADQVLKEMPTQQGMVSDSTLLLPTLLLPHPGVGRAPWDLP